MFTKLNKNKVLITGSLGFIISNFLRRSILNKVPYSFVSVDKVVNSSLLNNVYINKSLTNNYIADISDAHIIDKIFQFERPEIVIHAAAEEGDTLSMISSNIVGTSIVMNAAKKYGVNKIIYLSTDQVYGFLKEEIVANESAKTNPTNEFAISKLSSELFLKDFCENNNLNYIIARISNVYGPRQNQDKLIPYVIKRLLNDEPVELQYSSGENKDWLHVFDLCSALTKLLETDANNKTYNVSSGQYFSNLEIVYEISKYLQKDLNLVKFKDAENSWLISDNTELKNVGWELEYKFKSNIGMVCDWYQNNKWFLK